MTAVTFFRVVVVSRRRDTNEPPGFDRFVIADVLYFLLRGSLSLTYLPRPEHAFVLYFHCYRAHNDKIAPIIKRESYKQQWHLLNLSRMVNVFV